MPSRFDPRTTAKGGVRATITTDLGNACRDTRLMRAQPHVVRQRRAIVPVVHRQTVSRHHGTRIVHDDDHGGNGVLQVGEQPQPLRRSAIAAVRASGSSVPIRKRVPSARITSTASRPQTL